VLTYEGVGVAGPVLPVMIHTLDLVADPQMARRVRLVLDMYEFGEAQGEPESFPY
jgi:hypothetical protein